METDIENTESAAGAGSSPSAGSATMTAAFIAAMCCAGPTLSMPLPRGPGSRASRMNRGAALGAGKKDDEPFQDAKGQWYVRRKGTIRRLPNV